MPRFGTVPEGDALMTRLSFAGLFLVFALAGCGATGQIEGGSFGSAGGGSETGEGTGGTDGSGGGGTDGSGGGIANGGGAGGGGAGGGIANGGGAGGGIANGGGAGGGIASGDGGVAGGGAGGGIASSDGGGIPLTDGGMVSSGMGFFVTSRGVGQGGDLRGATGDGLMGADAFCKSLATAISPALGAKTWRAYLSTTTVNARTRIGTGPWLNAKAVTIAANLALLHDEGGMNALNLENTLDEGGNRVPVNVHDIISGTNADGTVAAGAHCNNWTARRGNAARVGHSNRAGGGIAPTSWQSAHDLAACTNPGLSAGGGRGSFYCFKAD